MALWKWSVLWGEGEELNGLVIKSDLMLSNPTQMHSTTCINCLFSPLPFIPFNLTRKSITVRHPRTAPAAALGCLSLCNVVTPSHRRALCTAFSAHSTMFSLPEAIRPCFQEASPRCSIRFSRSCDVGWNGLGVEMSQLQYNDCGFRS